MLLVANNADVVRQQSLAETRYWYWLIVRLDFLYTSGGINLTLVAKPDTQQARSVQPYSSATNTPKEEEEQIIKENNDMKVRVC